MSTNNRIKGDIIGCERIAVGYDVPNSSLIKSSILLYRRSDGIV